MNKKIKNRTHKKRGGNPVVPASTVVPLPKPPQDVHVPVRKTKY